MTVVLCREHLSAIDTFKQAFVRTLNSDFFLWQSITKIVTQLAQTVVAMTTEIIPV